MYEKDTKNPKEIENSSICPLDPKKVCTYIGKIISQHEEDYYERNANSYEKRERKKGEKHLERLGKNFS